MTDNLEKFWGRLDDINTGMLGATSDLRLVPMSHYVDRKTGCLWFITAKGTELATQAASGPKDAIHIVSDAREGLYTRIDGQLSLSEDRAKLDELWNAVAASWFEDGKQDEDVQLLQFRPTKAEVWTTDGSLAFLYEIAKAHLTDQKPDMGDHFSVAL